jgi:hypothetical protein
MKKGRFFSRRRNKEWRKRRQREWKKYAREKIPRGGNKQGVECAMRRERETIEHKYVEWM